MMLDSLIDLDLSDNNIQQIGAQVGLLQLRNLRKLYLNRNGISQLPSPTFAAFNSRESLQKLELAGNRLTDQSLGGDGGPGPFAPLAGLQELSLEMNALTTIPSAVLAAQRDTLVNLNLGLNQAFKHF
jgi:Leucine-rich repeat (LRR) protein